MTWVFFNIGESKLPKYGRLYCHVATDNNHAFLTIYLIQQLQHPRLLKWSGYIVVRLWTSYNYSQLYTVSSQSQGSARDFCLGCSRTQVKTYFKIIQILAFSLKWLSSWAFYTIYQQFQKKNSFQNPDNWIIQCALKMIISCLPLCHCTLCLPNVITDMKNIENVAVTCIK